MWLPSDDPIEKVYGNKLEKENIPLLGYIRVLNDDYESIIFINKNLIVGAWNLNAGTLNEFYENDAMEKIKIESESIIEIYETSEKLFTTVLELNEECKLSLPLSVDMFWDKIGFKSIDSREKLLSRYRISEPSENDLESLISGYKGG
ncbi:MAG TPA: DUF2226 domain-containing protein [Methanobacterium sp.]|nr:DUF2226 domain-containing protein [Methanobacterium sp.]